MLGLRIICDQFAESEKQLIENYYFGYHIFNMIIQKYGFIFVV